MTKTQIIQLTEWREQGKLEYKSDFGGWHCRSEFSTHEKFEDFRIKPSPTLRPWRPEEVPVGALIRFEKQSFISGKYLILASDNTGIVYCNTPDMSNPSLIKLKYNQMGGCEHSIDHGKTWLPCGVMD